MSYSITYYYASHIGKCRKLNQDNFLCVSDYLNHKNCGTAGIKQGRTDCKNAPLFGVFDGMGGEACGEMAAYIAAKELLDFQFGKNVKQDYIDFCECANAKICEYTETYELTSMGTTAAILRFSKAGIGLCNIGDSKIFQLSDGAFQQISHDHLGVSVFGKKPPLSQNLGIPTDELILSPYIATGNYQHGDVYLICSDGLTDMLTETDIESILQEENGFLAAEKLLSQALANGGKDNITFILIRIEKQKRRFFNIIGRGH